MPRAKPKRNLLIYAAGETDADMLYASSFQTPDPFVFVQTAAGRRHVLLSDLEVDRARKQSTAHYVHRLVEFTRLAKDDFGRPARVPDIVATFLKHLRIRRVDVPGNFHAGLADGLRKHGIHVVPASRAFFPQRVIKRPDEVAEINKAMRATETGLRAAVAALKASRIQGGYLVYRGRRLTSDTLRSIINTTVLSRGYIPVGTIVAGGVQGCDPHERGHGPLRANLPIIIDVFPRSEATGYYADITRTVVRGKASAEVQRIYRAVRDGQKRALAAVRHGADGRAVHHIIDRLFVERGFETGEKNGRMQGFFHSTGHGLGLDIHEPPRIGPVREILRAGMVVTVEPGLYYHPTGGVRIEDTVLVTRTGIENLTRFPKRLEI